MNSKVIENLINERVLVNENVAYTNPVLLFDDMHGNDWVFFGLDKSEAIKYIRGGREMVIDEGKPAVIIKVDLVSVQIFSWSNGNKSEGETFNAGRQQPIYFQMVNVILTYGVNNGGFVYITKEDRA